MLKIHFLWNWKLSHLKSPKIFKYSTSVVQKNPYSLLFYKTFTGKQCARFSFLMKLRFSLHCFQKETLAKVFFCECPEIVRKTGLVWCPLKGNTHLNKPATLKQTCSWKPACFFKHVRPFKGHPTLKG